MAARHARLGEGFFYVAVSAGMAISNAAFAMVSGLFALVPASLGVLALAIAGGVCVVIAASIGELASMWPSSPAVLTYFRQAFGPRAALVLIHLYLLFVVTIAGVESSSFALAVHAVLPQVPTVATIMLLLGAVVLVNLRGLELSRRMQIVTAFASIALIVGFGVAGIGAGARPLLVAPTPPQWAGLPAATALAVFIYTGFEWVTPVGLSRQAYARRVPRAMLIALALLFVTYALFVAGLGAVLPGAALAASATPQVALFGALAGKGGQALALLLAFGAIFSTFNAGILGGSQLLQAMARERSLPAWVGWIDLDSGAPTGAVLLLGGLALVSALMVATFDLILVAGLIASAAICLIYACYVGAAERLRRMLPDHPRPFRTRMPVAARYATIAAMPVIGVASLVSIPALTRPIAIGTAGAVLLVAALTLYSLRLRRQPPVRRVASAREGL